MPDCRLQIADFRSQIPDREFRIAEIADSRSQIPDRRFQIADTRSRIPDRRLQIAGSRSRIPDCRLQIPANFDGLDWRDRYWISLSGNSLDVLFKARPTAQVSGPLPWRLTATPAARDTLRR